MKASTNNKGLWLKIKEAPRKFISFLTEGATRIFSPRDDDYPEIGAQPFEGEPADRKKH